MAHDIDDSEPTWQTCVDCGGQVHLNWVDYKLDNRGEPDFTQPYHHDGCPPPTIGLRWYDFVDADDAVWLYGMCEDRGLMTVMDEFDRIADTVNPW